MKIADKNYKYIQTTIYGILIIHAKLIAELKYRWFMWKIDYRPHGTVLPMQYHKLLGCDYL